MIRLSEKPYIAINGEGIWNGMRMLFVRFQGCPVGCGYCDSRYTWALDKGEAWDVNKLTGLIGTTYTRHVWFTGGEPALFVPEIRTIMSKILTGQKEDPMFHICTSGQAGRECLHVPKLNVTYDLKSPSCGVEYDRTFFQELEYVRGVDKHIEVKMVVLGKDREWVLERLLEIPDELPVTIQPAYKLTKPYNEMLEFQSLAEWYEWAEKLVNEAYRDVRIGTQMHKLVYPQDQRGI